MVKILFLLLLCASAFGQSFTFEDAAAITPKASDAGDFETGLVAYWTFDTGDVSGASVTDASGNGNTATLNDGPSIVSGHINDAVELTGTETVSVPNSGTINLSGDFTVAFWVNFTSLLGGGFYPNVVAKISGGNNGYGAFYNGDGGGVAGIIGTSGGFTQTAVHVPSTGTWYHYAVTFTGGTLRLYVNGALSHSISASAPTAHTEDLKMGPHYSDPGTYGYIEADLDDVRVYNRALTAADVLTLYNFSG